MAAKGQGVPAWREQLHLLPPGPSAAEIRPMQAPEKHYPPFDDERFLAEIKFDGYRLLAGFGSDEGITLRTKGGTRAETWFPEICATLATIRGGPFVVDGEVVVLDSIGRSDFDRLRDRASRRRYVPDAPATYMVFDMMVYRGKNVMSLPLTLRKRLLTETLGHLNTTPGTSVLVLGDFPAQARLYQQIVVPLELEGLMVKRKDAPYQPGRSTDWRKVKRPGAVPPGRFKRAG
jgi:bifunctional non-homologous end joining protein LigD